MVAPVDVAVWQQRVLAASDLPQDDDDDVDAEQRFDLFLALLDDVDGSEGDDVLRTLLRCLRPQDDHGAYERLLGALARFPAERRGRETAEALPELVLLNEDMAGAVLADLARAGRPATSAFSRAAEALPAQERDVVAAFVRQEEADGGWLDGRDRRGRLSGRPRRRGSGG